VGFIFIKTHREQKRFEKVFDIGYDATVLGIGVAAALLGSSEFQKILNDNPAYLPLLFGIFILAML
jgi:hypothetical protein